MTARIPSLLIAIVLAGCASAPPPSPTARASDAVAPIAPAPPPPAAAASAPPPPTVAEQRTASASTLAVERQWLASWFKGTPVVIAQRPNGAVVVDVPLKYCFEPGKDAVLPPLAKVLDKVAESIKRTPIAELHLIAAPGDVAGGGPLAVKRAAKVYDYLRSQGVTQPRLTKPTATGATAVQLRIEASSPA